MTVTITIECDGKRCLSRLDLNRQEFENWDMEMDNQKGRSLDAEEWGYDSINDLNYCPHCVKKMIESGELEEPRETEG